MAPALAVWALRGWPGRTVSHSGREGGHIHGGRGTHLTAGAGSGRFPHRDPPPYYVPNQDRENVSGAERYRHNGRSEGTQPFPGRALG